MTERAKKIMKYTALGLCAAIILSVVVMALYFRNETGSDVPEASVGMQVEPAETRGVSLAIAEISPAEYEEHDVMPIAEKAYTLTATVNGDATVKAVDWTVAFQNPASEWATGKAVREYVTVSSTGDLTATVQCLKAFGEKILVSAVSRDTPTAMATCVCDYEKHIEAASVSFQAVGTESSLFNNDSCVSGALWGTMPFFVNNCYVDARPVYGIGTIEISSAEVSVTFQVKLSSEAKQKLQEKGYSAGATSEYGFRLASMGRGQSHGEIGTEALKTLFGANVQSASFYRAVKALQGENFHQLLEAVVRFEGAQSHTEIATVSGYLDIDANAIYVPVASVQLSQQSIVF